MEDSNKKIEEHLITDPILRFYVAAVVYRMVPPTRDILTQCSVELCSSVARQHQNIANRSHEQHPASTNIQYNNAQPRGVRLSVSQLHTN